MKPYHYILITIGFAFTSEIADGFGHMFINIISTGEQDYLSYRNQIIELVQGVIVLSYPLVVLWLAFPKNRPDLSIIKETNGFAKLFSIAAIAILLSIITHPFKEFYLLQKYYNAEPNTQYSTLNRGTVIYTLGAYILIFIIPVIHEILFRKYIIDGLIRLTTKTKIFLTQLACYVLFLIITSGSLTEMLTIGIVCGLIYLRTQNIYLCITFNLIFSVSTELITSQSANEFLFDTIFGVSYWIIIGVSALIVGLLTLKIKQLTFSDEIMLE